MGTTTVLSLLSPLSGPTPRASQSRKRGHSSAISFDRCSPHGDAQHIRGRVCPYVDDVAVDVLDPISAAMPAGCVGGPALPVPGTCRPPGRRQVRKSGPQASDGVAEPPRQGLQRRACDTVARRAASAGNLHHFAVRKPVFDALGPLVPERPGLTHSRPTTVGGAMVHVEFQPDGMSRSRQPETARSGAARQREKADARDDRDVAQPADCRVDALV